MWTGEAFTTGSKFTALPTNMAAINATTSVPELSQAEAGVLELYDKVQQLQLQLAVLRAQERYTQGVYETYQHDRDGACLAHALWLTSLFKGKGSPDGRTRLLEANASLSLRDRVIESVVAVQPTLKAVHHATHASPVERWVLH